MLIVACGLVALVEVMPVACLAILAGLSVAQCALLQVHDFKFYMKTTRQHGMRELPKSLLALQHKRRRFMENHAKANADSPAACPPAGSPSPAAEDLPRKKTRLTRV